jgi:hypothetical protein
MFTIFTDPSGLAKAAFEVSEKRTISPMQQRMTPQEGHPLTHALCTVSHPSTHMFYQQKK